MAAALLAWVSYDLSNRSVERALGALSSAETVRALLRADSLLQRSLSTASVALATERHGLLRDSQLQSRSVESELVQGIPPSERRRFDPQLERVQEVQRELDGFVGRAERGEAISRAELWKLAVAAQGLGADLAREESLEWDRLLRLGRELSEAHRRSILALEVVSLLLALLLGVHLWVAGRTERAERLVRETERIQSTLISSLSEGVILCDTEGSILAFNERASEILGRSPEGLAGKGVEQVFSSAADDTPVRQAIAQGRALSAERLGLRRADGGIQWLTVNSLSLFEGEDRSRRSSIVFAFSDVTERVHAIQTIRRQREQMRISTKMSALGEMASGIAHEINNPVAVIHGNAEHLRDLVAAKGTVEPEVAQGIAERIAATALRVAKIVRGIATFARSGDQDPPVRAALRRLVDDTLAFCAHRFRASGVSLAVGEIPAGLALECREVQVSEVLVNLLNNARDAAESTDEKWVRLDVEDLGDRVALRITDSGRGIPRAVQERMFQGHFTTKEAGKGTGLGFILSRRIVEEHGGSIRVDESCPNTRIVVTLPKDGRGLERELAA